MWNLKIWRSLSCCRRDKKTIRTSNWHKYILHAYISSFLNHKRLATSPYVCLWNDLKQFHIVNLIWKNQCIFSSTNNPKCKVKPLETGKLCKARVTCTWEVKPDPSVLILFIISLNNHMCNKTFHTFYYVDLFIFLQVDYFNK